MALGSSTIPVGSPALNAVKGIAFDTTLDTASTNSNILAQLQGAQGDDKPFVVRTELTAGAKDTITFNVAAELGAAGRRGTDIAVGYEEQLYHNSWTVQIDHLRVVVGRNELDRVLAASGGTWQALYPVLCGKRLGQIEQEDMLMRFRQRSGPRNTLRPQGKALNALNYDDTFDTALLSRGISLAKTNGIKPATIATGKNGMPIQKLVCLIPQQGSEQLWQDPQFTTALLHAEVDGPMNPLWTDDLPNWRGCMIKSWDIVNHDNPGPIMSSLMPQAILGDPITSDTAAFTVYGGGRTQASLGDPAGIYLPFEYFYGCNKLFGKSISYGVDANTYYFVVIDPADGLWNLYSYVGSTGILSAGNAITITNRLHSSSAGIAYTHLNSDGIGGSGSLLYTYDASVNKVTFPTGSLIIQVNLKIVPVFDAILFGKDAGAKAYGQFRNKRIEQIYDYTALNGVGVMSTYGQDLRKDTLGNYFRNFVRFQAAYDCGYTLPHLA